MGRTNSYHIVRARGRGNWKPVGDRIVPDWRDFEALNPNAKLRLLCERLGIAYDKTEEPWGTVRWLVKLRNTIAHAKPESVRDEYIVAREEHDGTSRRPLSQLEQQLTLDNAKRALNATEEVLLRLTGAILLTGVLGCIVMRG